MFYCHGGQHRFSEMSYSNLINKKGTEKEYPPTFKLIKYGLSSEQIADVLEKDPRTIEAWVKAIAEKSQHRDWICSLTESIPRGKTKNSKKILDQRNRKRFPIGDFIIGLILKDSI